MIREFNLAISEKTLNEVYARVQRYPWQALPNNSGWDLGTDTAYLKELCHYWVSDFDWYRHENEINRFDNFVAQIDDIDIHFIHEKGSGPNPQPLLISHGWPGSVVEFLEVIDKLAHPERFGGNIDDAFDVVVP
ncbi:MAG: epoxide hydrolase N-terminal domain-containing protein, partial [Gammaproteobacteria bacterium]|nr:epoxide hydrolase N-terminal domain-containing protein [Gammaproteobacteria bacterium]